MLKTIVYCPLFIVRPALTKSVAWTPSFMLEPPPIPPAPLVDEDDELLDDEPLELLDPLLLEDPLPVPGRTSPSTSQPGAAIEKSANEPRKTNQFHWYRKDTSPTDQGIPTIGIRC